MKKTILLTILTVFAASFAFAQQRPLRKIQQVRQNRHEAKANTAGTKTFHLQLEGVNREFVVYRPTNVPTDQKTPVVFAFHGTGHNGPKFLEESGWKEKADEVGLTVVCGSALRYHVFKDEMYSHGEVKENVSQFTTKWNFFRLSAALDPKYPNQRLYDDVKFVLAMIDTVKQNYAVDVDRFYATGFSNGAQFTTRLAVQLTNVFAAYGVCAIGNPLTQEDLKHTNEYTSEPFKPRPVMHVLGEVDGKVALGAGVASFPLDESAVAPNSFLRTKVISIWGLLLKLEDKYDYKRTQKAATFRYHTPTSGGQQELDLAIVQGMGHVYPNGGKLGFRIADWYWQFMSKYKR